MIEEALEGDCLFCVGNLLGSDDQDPENHVAKIGTIGLIRASRESEEGTSNLILHGVFRVKFEEWFSGEKPYPFAAIKPMLSTTLEESEEKVLRKRLRAAANLVLAKLPDQVAEQINRTLDKAGDAVTVADAISQQFVNDPNDRQRLLATGEARERIDFLIQFLEKAGSNDLPF